MLLRAPLSLDKIYLEFLHIVGNFRDASGATNCMGSRLITISGLAKAINRSTINFGGDEKDLAKGVNDRRIGELRTLHHLLG